MPDIVAAYAAATTEKQQGLPRALVRTKSRQGRDVLAALATDLQATAEELEEIGRAYRRGHKPQVHLDPRRVLDYTRVAAVQTSEPADRAAALGLLQWVLHEHRELFRVQHGTLLLQLALAERNFSLADSAIETLPVAEGPRGLAGADLANPWIRPAATDERQWLDALNAGLFGPDAVQATILPEGDTPFDRLTTTSNDRITDERKITVVISCYNPDRHLLTAVRSVVEQTWQNFELFVVDDASPNPMPGVLDEVERMDPRVTVIRKAINGGTYRARNTALRLSTGDFFTCLDSDDWAHPQRLELGVRPMLEDESLVATRSMGVRATEQMELSRVGYGGRFKAASSLMIRTFPVVNRVGFFDPVRKAADNEYALRMEAAFDGKVVDVRGHALTILLADAGSLSASDYSPGWRHPARSEYFESYSEWHRQVQWRQAPMFLRPHGRRAFPAPRRWQRHPQDGPPGPSLDVVVIADWRARWVAPRTLDRLQSLVGEGRRVGIIHLESLVAPPRTEHPLAPPVRDLVHRGLVERVYLDDTRHSSLTVLADPRVLQFPPIVDPRLTSSRVVVVADLEAEQRSEYARSSVDQHTHELLGTEPGWHDDWPAGPLAPPRSPVAEEGGGTVHFTGLDEPRATPELTVESWLLREPADGERGARISLVRRSDGHPHDPELSELSDAWAGGGERWDVLVTRWLDRSPGVWAVAVQRTTEVRLAVAAGVCARRVDGQRAVRLEHEAGASATVLAWQGGEFLHRPAENVPLSSLSGRRGAARDA